MKNLNDFIYSIQQDRMLMEMASIGEIDNQLILIIRMNDPGNIPHFHICDKQTLGNKFHTCIKIESAEYFHHTGKEDILNSKQRKSLVEFLKSSSPKKISNWDVLVMMWNINNSKMKVDEDIEMPNYLNLK